MEYSDGVIYEVKFRGQGEWKEDLKFGEGNYYEPVH